MSKDDIKPFVNHTEEDWDYAVGDISSKEKGSGARANGGKPRMDLIPLAITLRAHHAYLTSGQRDVLYPVARFEEGDDEAITTAVARMLPADLEEAARVLEYGSHKYAAWNWLKGMPWSVPLGCIGRHLNAISAGEELDEESGHTHWGHVVCNIIMLAMYVRVYRDGDDRPPKELFV